MKQKHRGKAARRRAARRKKHLITALIVALALIMAALTAYVVHWYINLGRIRADGQRYRRLYSVTVTAMPALEATAVPATAAPTPEPTIAPTPEPTARRIIIPTASPVFTAEPTAAPTPEPTARRISIPSASPVFTAESTAAPTPEPTARRISIPTATPLPDMPIPDDRPIPTPDGDTLVYALPTPPPVQDSFNELLALNPDTMGYLDADGVISLPVVQRENDNDYYLSHSFEGDETAEGALFLDGLNRLVPEDDCLIVYGHNMKNDTMFGRLSAFGSVDFLRQHSIVRFDTIYENRAYVPFAAFTASMEPDNRRYFDVRQFIFDEMEFDKFVLKLKSRSVYSVPVDVSYGDHLLLLVTCDYTNEEGRFILALRQLRADESEANMWALVMQATAK